MESKQSKQASCGMDGQRWGRKRKIIEVLLYRMGVDVGKTEQRGIS